MSALKEIRDRAAAATPGPWQWFGNVDAYSTYLATVNDGRRYVMQFVRWGMRGAQPRFRSKADNWAVMEKASDLAVFEVCPTATDRDDTRVYRGDLVGFRNADAEFIAHSRQDVDDLLAVVAAIEAVCDEYEPMNARNDDVRFGADAVLKAIRAALAGEL